jgi:adenine-specific DNA-methyltransferase
MMYDRFCILHTLLAKDGAIFVHLDDNEADYCKILLDEVFGRKNFMNRITVDARSPSAFSTVNPGMFVASEYVLYYAKDRKSLKEKQLKAKRNPDYAYNRYIKNINSPYTEWEFCTVAQAFNSMQLSYSSPENLIKKYNDFIVKNADRICRYTAISDTGAGAKIIALKKQSLEEPNKILKLEREGLDDVYVINGQQISFYKKNIALINGELCATMPLTDIWSDIAWEGIAKEGDVTFKRGKKPERLLHRCIQLVTAPYDIVLDSFLGSGTTAAVAHKMGRRYIGVEMGNHAYTHCAVRLKKVIDGTDQGGISKAQNWKGGGGFRFYELAPSLLKEDKFGNLVINKEYNADMLAAAMAKQEGFTFEPSNEHYWKQGFSSENDYIYTTTQFMTVEGLAAISEQMKEGESLLVCCTAFQKECRNAFANITIKKIPKMLLGRCEFNKDDYSLNIIDLPSIEESEEE